MSTSIWAQGRSRDTRAFIADAHDRWIVWRARRVLARVTAKADTAVIVHLFYPEVWPVLAAYIARLNPSQVDVFVTVPKQKQHAVSLIRESFPDACCIVVPNRGRDVLPFLLVAERLDRAGYEVALKLHSKKSEHFGGGDQWRDQMLDELLPSDPAVVTTILDTLHAPRTGMVGPRSTYFPLTTYWAGNAATVERLLRPAVSAQALARLRSPKDLGFFAGTMFWARLDALRPLLKVQLREFVREPTPKDGTLSHALERAMPLLPELLGRDQYDTDGTRVAARRPVADALPQWYRAATKTAIEARRAQGGPPTDGARVSPGRSRTNSGSAYVKKFVIQGVRSRTRAAVREGRSALSAGRERSADRPAIDVGPSPVQKSPPDLVWAEVTSHDWPGARPVRSFFDLLLEAIGTAPRRKILVAADTQAEVWEQVITAAWPDARVTVTTSASDESVEHARLAVLAPFDVVVQAADADGLTQVRTFQRVFWHLGPGGIYLTPRVVPVDVGEDPGADEPEALARVPLPNEEGSVARQDGGDVWQLVSEAEARRLRDFRDTSDGIVSFAELQALGRRVREIRVSSKMLWLDAEGRTQAKLTEDEADAVLLARPELGREIGQVPAATVQARAPYGHNLPEDPYFSHTMTSPRLRLRRYERPICSRGQIVTTGDLIWPDTFRHHLYPRLTNIYVEESAPRFGHVRRDISDPDELPGAWFHLDNEWPGHFGHMLTDQLGRMWAWDEVKRREPEVKVLLTLNHDRDPAVLRPWEVEYFAAFDIKPGDVHIFTKPCRPQVLYSASSMFSLADYVHPDITEVWRRAGDALARRSSPGPWPTRIFCTRPTTLKRPCHNTGDVEDLFRRYGFEVIDPAEHSLPDQVAMFRAAQAVGGFLGSGLFNLAFCPTPTPVYAVGPVTYNARNEHLICALLGHPLVTAWTTASDIAHPDGSWTPEAFASGFTVDLATEGRFLEEYLGQLPPRER